VRRIRSSGLGQEASAVPASTRPHDCRLPGADKGTTVGGMRLSPAQMAALLQERDIAFRYA